MIVFFSCGYYPPFEIWEGKNPENSQRGDHESDPKFLENNTLPSNPQIHQRTEQAKAKQQQLTTK